MNIRFKYILSLLVIMAISFSLAGYLFTTEVNSEEQLTSDSAEVAFLRGQVEELRKELADFKQANQPPPPDFATGAVQENKDFIPPAANGAGQEKLGAQSNLPAVNAPGTGSFAQQNPPTEAEEESYLQRVSMGYDNALASEELDQQWATNEESGFRDRLNNSALSGTGLGSIACRSTLCRVDLNHATDDAKEELMSSLHSVVGPRRGQVFYRHVYNPDGTSTTVLYVSRDGERLPEVNM